MSEQVERVVNLETPVHFDDLARRITLNAGLSRAGSRIVARVREGVQEAKRRGLIRVDGEFLWSIDGAPPKVRDRSALEPTARSVSRIAPEEIDVAIRTVVELSLGVPEEELCSAVARMFGLQRTSTDVAQVFVGRASALVHAGELRFHEGLYRPRTQT